MKRGTPDHPKTRALASALHIPIYSVVGILEMLWHFTADYAPRGDVGRFSDEDIARAVGWHGQASRLVGALQGVGYLEAHPEHRYIIHDWETHADRAIKQRLERNGLTFVVSTQRANMDARREHMSTLPEPAPEPVHKPAPAPVFVEEVRAPVPLAAVPAKCDPDEFQHVCKVIWESHPKDRRGTLLECGRYASDALQGALNGPALLQQAADNHRKWLKVYSAGGWSHSLKNWWTEGHWSTDPGEPGEAVNGQVPRKPRADPKMEGALEILRKRGIV